MNIHSLKTVKAEQGAVMEVTHPETEEVIKGMSITLLGQDSSTYRKIMLKRQQAALNRMSKGKKADALNAEKLAEDSIDDLVAMTIGWAGFDDEKGAPILFSAEEVRKVYSDPELGWLIDQVREFVGDRANFFAK